MKKKLDIKELSVEELNAKLVTEEENLRRLRFGHAVSPIENPMRIGQARKAVARIKTELRAKQQ